MLTTKSTLCALTGLALGIGLAGPARAANSASATKSTAPLTAAPMDADSSDSADSGDSGDVALPQAQSRADLSNLHTERRYLLDPVELTPVLGFTVINGSAGFNVGAHAAYPLLATAPLYAEPSLLATLMSGNTMISLNAAARYDIPVAGTTILPFARAGIGPTFQTSGSTAVFNASFGGGVLYPIKKNLDLRAELGLVDIDGNAGVQVLTGLSL